MSNADPQQLAALRERLSDWRRDLGLTQQQAADRCGIKKRSYEDYERGLTMPRADHMHRLSIGTGIDWRELLEPAAGGEHLQDIIASQRVMQESIRFMSEEIRRLREDLSTRAAPEAPEAPRRD